MLAYRVEAVVTADHHVTAIVPDDVPPGVAELLVLVESVPVVNDPDDLALYHRGMEEYEAGGRKTFSIEAVAAELGISIPDAP